MPRTVVVSLASVLLLVAAPAPAHEAFRIVGTVIKQDPAVLVVKTSGGDIVSMELGVWTSVWRGGNRVEATEVKLGVNVDVEAWGDSVADLQAMRVHLVAK